MMNCEELGADTRSDRESQLARAKQLVACLEAGDQKGADDALRDLASKADPDLFNQLGRLTRELHDSLGSFVNDCNVAEIAHVEIPNASERLRYVISMTEQAANTTLGAVEKGMPLIEELDKGSERLAQGLTEYQQAANDSGAFTDLQQDLTEFLSRTSEEAKELHTMMTEVLMAQEFQDLSGQIIRKVIVLVQSVEEKLVQLVRLAGQKAPVEKARKPAAEELAGPAVPGVSDSESLTGQDDVDDLLSSLGF